MFNSNKKKKRRHFLKYKFCYLFTSIYIYITLKSINCVLGWSMRMPYMKPNIQKALSSKYYKSSQKKKHHLATFLLARSQKMKTRFPISSILYPAFCLYIYYYTIWISRRDFALQLNSEYLIKCRLTCCLGNKSFQP